MPRLYAALLIPWALQATLLAVVCLANQRTIEALHDAGVSHSRTCPIDFSALSASLSTVQMHAGLGSVLTALLSLVVGLSLMRTLRDRIACEKTQTQVNEHSRSEMVQMITHDLTTPLSSVRAAMDILETKADCLDQDGRRVLKIGASNVRRMFILLNDLMDLQFIQADRLKLSKSQVPVIYLFDEVRACVETSASGKEINLEFATDVASVVVDAKRVIQILVNLVHNAIKFSPRRSTIKISAHQLRGSVSFSVCDSGRGIPAHMLQSIFDRFRQVEAADYALQQGRGLGLSICKQLVELHGGEFGVQSRVGSGSTFWFTMPQPAETNVALSGARADRRCRVERAPWRVPLANLSEPAWHATASSAAWVD